MRAECFCKTQRYTASCGDRVNIHVGCTFFFEKQAGCCFDTTNLSASHGQPPLSLDTSDTRINIWYPQPSPGPTTHRHQIT